ncbi:MAG: HNH endonuclease [Bacilli bacterium]
MKRKEFKTIGEYFYWLYANMSMAHVALKNNHTSYEMLDYMIRSKLYKGLCNGTMNIQSLYLDEKDKLNNLQCCYCGKDEKLTLDHLVPKYLGGEDTGDNLVYSCQHCNSSKNNKDLIVWYAMNNDIPPILVLRRYLKLAFFSFESLGVLELPFSELENYTTIYLINLLPYEFPQPILLRL